MIDRWLGENYFEAHITFAPVEGKRLESLQNLALFCDFRVADLLKRNGETSDLDTFASARHTDSVKLKDMMRMFIVLAREWGFEVWRYKMEMTVLDSRFNDRWGYLDR